jgi:sec-independent protein translocase protein TatA
MTALVPLFPGIPGGPELMIVLLIVVLLFGANKVPKLARASGQAMGEFKRGRDELEEEIRSSRSESSTEVESSDAVETESA